MSRKKPASLTAAGFTASDCLEHPRLMGHAFRPAESWHAWSVILSAIEGLPIADPDLALYRQLTGRVTPSATPRPSEVWISAGRRSGKSRAGALLAVHAAAFVNWRARLAPGETAVIACLAADKAQARVIHGYCRGLVEASPLVGAHVTDGKSDVLTFDTGASIEVHASDYRSLRGRSYALILADEVAYWEGSPESANPDQEIIRAVRPGLATLGGRLIGISSPYAQRGVLFEQFRKHWAKDGDPVLVVRADSRTLNPSLSEQMIAEAFADDPEAARAEWAGLFRNDLSDMFTPEALAQCTAQGRAELPPSRGQRYVGALDAAGGGGADSFAFAIASLDRPRGRVVLDCVKEWRPPFDPLAVVSEIATLARTWGIRLLQADRWGGQFVVEAFAREGLVVQHAEQTTSEVFLEFASMINAKIVEVPDHPRLLYQLGNLQRSTRSGGRDRVEHRPGQHDDLAAALACVTASAGLRRGGLRPHVVLPTARPTVEIDLPAPQKMRTRSF